MKLKDGQVIDIVGSGETRGYRVVLDAEQVAAIRLIIEDEKRRDTADYEDMIRQSHEDGFDPFNGI